MFSDGDKALISTLWTLYAGKEHDPKRPRQNAERTGERLPRIQQHETPLAPRPRPNPRCPKPPHRACCARIAIGASRAQVHVVQGFESGRVVPTNAVIAKMERLLGAKLPRVRAPRPAPAEAPGGAA